MAPARRPSYAPRHITAMIAPAAAPALLPSSVLTPLEGLPGDRGAASRREGVADNRLVIVNHGDSEHLGGGGGGTATIMRVR